MNLSPAELDELVARKGSATLREQWPRYAMRHQPCILLSGSSPLEIVGDWEPFRYLEDGGLIVVDGSVDVSHLLDMVPDANADYTGALLILGNLTCGYFANYFGGLVIVDGDLKVDRVAVNAFEDSALVVTKDVHIHYFHGLDIWVEYGGQATLEYGEGYALAIGWDKEPGRPRSVSPRHDIRESIAYLGLQPDPDKYIAEEDVVRAIRAGRI